MPLVRRKLTIFCVMIMLNVFICVLMGVSWNLRESRGAPQQVQARAQSLLQQVELSRTFWNREQQRLDLLHNLSVSSPLELPDWLNDTRSRCEPDLDVRTQVHDYNSLPPRFQDFLMSMRCRSYPMLINQPDICGQKPFLLLAIKSLIPHFDRRQAIRQTWGHAGLLANRSVVTVFLLGSVLPQDHQPDLGGLLDYEARHHRDLLQWDYRDTFFNLTLKEVLFLEWFSSYCPHAQFVLKGDDDVFINTPRVLDHLEDLAQDKVRNLFIGDVITNAGPHRDPKLKYFIPHSVFVGAYPPYAGGGGYLYSGDLALRLHNVSKQVALYPIDDVFTGMCLKKLGLVPEKNGGFRTFDIEAKYRYNACVHRSLMMVHSRTPQETLTMWPWIIHPELDCQ